MMRDLWDFAMDMSPYGLLCLLLPILCVLAPVEASSEFPVHRLAQYELGNSLSVGSKVSFVSLEARTLSCVPNVLRKLVIARIQDVSVSGFNELIQAGIGGLLLVVPGGDSLPGNVDSVLQLEEHLLSTDVDIPIYFAPENEDLLRLMEELEREGVSPGSTAFQTLMNNIVSSGYQFVTSSSSNSKALPNPGIVTLHGQLSGRGDEDSLPTILLVAHYDASGAAPGMSYGADSNGSGVTILMELARLWNKLYSSSRTHPGYNLVFLLSGGGKINFLGTKKWLEEHQDNDLSSEILSNVAFVACLDTLGHEEEGSLYFHVSKPPKEESLAGRFLKHLQNVAHVLNSEININVVHKKINLAEEILAWEHERFSIRRLQAFTLSSLASHNVLKRNSILDTKVSMSLIHQRTRLIAEALACSIYGQLDCNGQLFGGPTLSPNINSISTFMAYLASTSRATSQLVHSGKSNLEGSPKVIQDMAEMLKSRSHNFKILISKRDKREAEFTFYDGASTTMNAYKVKPAVFDLFLTLSISAYLGLLYLILTRAGYWISLLKMSSATKKSSTPIKSDMNGNGRIKTH
ncbi:BOS complex subunit ncln [Lepeophtheirus salmonis]|uniref:BOS complex subunit NCLN n=1 Tax=Lepeophtheirus salmonis TaxID=72036 RepID=A0A0K2UEM2_LEPSM|nr:nicalin-1-like [Lepeophtheirus salmonis]